MRAFAKGDRGNEIVDIQVKLSALGYGLGPSGADGCFGELTEEAVKKFQSDRKLTANGIVDEATWKALVGATYKLGSRLLYLRAPFFRGDDVRELQISLNTLGFNTGKVDGIYGETTERAVREFQRNYGLPSDGIFGPSTFTAMRNLRHLLDGKVSHIFPDPHRDQPSAISVFHSRRIAVDLVGLDGAKRQDGGEEADISQDLGMRLGNLLELLGANVYYIENEQSCITSDPVELYVGFGLSSSPNHKSCGSTVLYCSSVDELDDGHFDERSEMMATLRINIIISTGKCTSAGRH